MRKKLNYILTPTILIVITYYSLKPQGLSAPGTGSSKPLHLVAYLALSTSIMLNLYGRKYSHTSAVFLATVYGFLIELIQLQLPTRFFRYEDILLNFLGSGLILMDFRKTISGLVIDFEEKILEEFGRFLLLLI